MDTTMSLFADGVVLIDRQSPTARMQGNAAIAEGLRRAVARMQSFGYTTVNYFESENGQRAVIEIVAHLDEEEAVHFGADYGVLKQAEVGVPVAEVIRKAGISEQTFYRWKAKYAGLESGPGPSDGATAGGESALEPSGSGSDVG